MNKEINESIRKEKDMMRSTVKLLLLGAGESGKTTFLKQLKIIHSSGFSEPERKTFKTALQGNIMINIMALLEASRTLKDVPPLAIENQEIAQKFDPSNNNARASFEEMSKYVKLLWKDPAIQHCYKRAAEFQLQDNAEYLFENIDQIASPDFIPSVDDVLKVRAKTSGITEVEMTINENRWMVVDVGGQRSERRKWIHCFDDVSAVIFFASLSEYDQKLHEDQMTNRMSESLKLFKDISNYRAFIEKDIAIMLFLNKKDIFQKKIQEVPLNVYFKNYTGPNEYNKACSFIRKEFLKLAPPNKQIHVFKTCATDTNNIRLIFRTVKEHIINANLKKGGLFVAPPPKREREKPRTTSKGNVSDTKEATTPKEEQRDEPKDAKEEDIEDEDD